jgi:nucleoside-diphosphate-sugar epimerase
MTHQKVLVTGALGYIGSVLVDYLQQRHCEVTTLDTGFFEKCLLSPEISRGHFWRMDMRDLTEARLAAFDAVIHLAGISNDPFGDLMPQQVYDSSTDYSVQLAKWCKAQHKKLIFASSCSIYGKAMEPVTTELTEPNPQTFYSLNKLQIEQQVSALADKEFHPVLLRLATLYGPSPRMRFDIVVNMLTAMAATSGAIVLNSDGRANRPFLHIEDACQAFYCALSIKTPEAGAIILNVGQDQENYSIREVAELISQTHGSCELKSLVSLTNAAEQELFKDRKLQDGVDSRDYKVSFAKIKQSMPTFQPNWQLSTGVKQLFGYYQDVGLTDVNFKSADFFRLQTMEALYKSGRITPELKWANPL